MELEKFLKYIQEKDPVFRKKCLISCVFMVSIVLIIIGSIFYIRYDNAKIAAINAQMKDMNVFIQQYKINEIEYQNRIAASARPIEKSEIDIVQNALIQKMLLYKIGIKSMQAVADNTAKDEIPNGKEFEITINGSWEDTMRYLHDLKSEPEVINLKMVRMEATSEATVLKTTFK